MSVDRTFRSLASLSTASTSRVLNLLAITRSHGENKDFIANAMFSSPMLNNAIILKHRVRGRRRGREAELALGVDRRERPGGRYVRQLNGLEASKNHGRGPCHSAFARPDARAVLSFSGKIVTQSDIL